MNKHIPFLDLHRQYASIKPGIDKAIQGVLKRQMFILGEELDKFEKDYADYLNIRSVVGVNSGTDGLILALRALGIGKGDEVITQTNSFIATAIAISEVGATPVLVDIDPNTYEMDVDMVKKKITKKTKAILPVHLYGAPAPIEDLVELAKAKGLFLIEDACQAHGATYKNKKLGTFGDVSVYSFYPGKNLGAYGDAGAIATQDSKIADKLIKLRNYGMTKKYYHDTIGYNSRLDEIQAAVLRTKLKKLDQWNKKRNAIAKQYITLLPHIKKQTILPDGTSNYHLFVIEIPTRDKLQAYLKTHGIDTLIHYPVPIHLQACYKDLGYKKGDMPHAEKSSERLLSLPMYPELRAVEVAYITECITRY